VTPPLFLVPDLGAGPQIVLTGPEAHHAATVRRLSQGERVLLADGRGGLADCVVTAVDRTRIVLAVESRREVPEPSPRFVVVQALPKGERADLAVEILTELGVDEIVPWSAARSISQWRGDKADKGVAKWQRTALEASKQSRRPRVPLVAKLTTTAEVRRRVASAAAAVVLHEGAGRSLGDVAAPEQGDLVVIVGPEGGVSDEELAAFTEAGALPVRLGPEVMRTSTAGAAALAVLSSAVGRWR